MTVTDTIATDLDAQIGAYAERLFETGLAALEAITISLGRELGLYDHLTDDGGVTAGELSQRRRHRRALRPGVARATGRRRTHRRHQPRAPTPTSDASGSRPPPRSACSAPRAWPRSGPLFDLLPAVNRVLPGRARRRLPHRWRHPLRRLRAPRRPGRLQPARLREPPRRRTGCRRSPDSSTVSTLPAPAQRRSAAARDGRRSHSPGRSPSSGSTASTTTKRPSWPPASTPPTPV